ncbi:MULTISPECIES: fatty acyl-AMP ligase [Commensalibacter]|uniref:Beta-ketoacyl synthase n=2 Tax=Commensalibacter TaxID=1079922 RepID=W7DJG7_9PROT|nr:MULTISPECIES: fatty acyl-AMP ligase [Commensalibacter]EUK17492.1 beta-ketoacyl synthase [Commensalibacter papalotli (ex Servin-Garciduenas et al. 2014)]CAI3956612.1 O-succinylbenzoic acid-CoA ligase MenE or related acyl-CoA synthetase (AMP-forming) (MenE/FadK) (PDB:5EY9) (PUBMED:25151136 [Commensalibacter papalotli (ex Botero et al. 2024)]CAI3956819.1 O-succinylbenzoic acid-CoA ligase MenE or related acyl-CoA synthetase (AMP-forming) (MenE/FadK) (PDB:5EY9) (PUBMED:25151136 [Commensalibacter p
MALIIPDDTEEDWACKAYGIVDWHTSTLVDMLQHRAKLSPSMVLYTLLDGDCNPVDHLTSVQLDDNAATIAAGLLHFGKKGDRVLLLCDNDLNYISAFFGCIYAGMIPASGVHIDVMRSDERFEMVANDAQPRLIIGPRKILADYKAVHKDLDCKPIWVSLEVLLNAKNKIAIKGDNQGVAFIQYTSGTTKNTRGIELTHRNLIFNLRHQAKSYEYLDEDYSGLSWLPLAHDMGLIGCVLLAIGTGGRCTLLPPKYFIEKPVRWLKALTKYKVSMSGGPTFAYNLCTREVTEEEMQELDLSHWELALNGADTAQADIMQRFCKKFADVGFRARHLVFGYGLAEATLTVTRTKRRVSPKFRSFSRSALMAGFAWPSTNKFDRRELISCGTSLEDQKVAIVDPESRKAVRSGRVGEIWISGPSIAKGYFQRPELTEEVFHAKIVGQDENYLRTGDLGFLLDNNLFFSGRMSNVIVLRGKTYDPDDVSGALEAACSDIRPNATAFFLANPEDFASITVIIELVKKPLNSYEEIAEKAYEVITKTYDIWPKMIVLTRPGGVLKTPSGKAQIARTRKALHENALPVIQKFEYEVPDLPPPLSREEALIEVEKWIAEETKDWDEDVKELTREKLVNREVDSELLLNLRRAFEHHFHIQIDPSEFMVACQDYKDLCNLLAGQISVSA